MSGKLILRWVSMALLILAAIIAVLGYGEYAAGETTKLAYATSFGGPLLVGIAMQIFARANLRAEGSKDA